MAKPRPPEIESAGSDSFLDVITNIVGILIILVMVVGERCKNIIVPAGALANPHAAELATIRSTGRSVEGDVHRIAQQMKIVEAELIARADERLQLATLLSAADHDLAQHRGKLDDSARRQYDLQRDLAFARADLSNLQAQEIDKSVKKKPSVEVETYPTPISKVVDGREIHIQLKAGCVTIVPMDDLVNRLKSHAQERLWKLRDLPEMTDTIGPIDGFVLRYTIARIDVPLEETMQTGRGGSRIELTKYDLVPMSGQLGDPIDEALAEDSAFRRRLGMFPARDFTVTLWTYADSFESFRKIRKELYHQGYAVAGRPLPDGIPIGGSPQGTKSASE